MALSNGTTEVWLRACGARLSRQSLLAPRTFLRSLAPRGGRRLLHSSLVDFRQSGGEHVELLLPVLAVAVHPDGRVEQGARVQAAPADASGALLLDEPRPHQYLDVTGHGLQFDLERGRELGDQQWQTVEPH